MADYIKREDAIKSIIRNDHTDVSKEFKRMFAEEMLSYVKDKDVVSIVRCKDCKFAHMTYGGECKYCDAWESEESLYLDGDFFCAFGERKNDD